jgi:Transposase
MSRAAEMASGARERKRTVSQQRTEEFRRAAVEKFQSRGSRTVQEVARVLGVSSWSLYQWSKDYGKGDGMRKNRRPAERSAQEKLKAVIEFERLEGEQQGEYLRREGLHSEHIAGWKKSMEAGLESGGGSLTAANRSEWAADKKKIKELERDLSRKDRALAETTALLVLKKKADLIWGSGENE